ncbi:hypothetical protein P6U16_25850 (plasmid) [Rhizobium sp. 32-5/1]|uniref:hypothetical protein n=1 Tax=Rhizobium sp. 32-5/1 TaxID=3019602 RepID=UPI00240E2C95|nr:hypothetical protein [Rhizobium sp. 32-5/1]WEZ85494.1 hypothetical protein P6U16_25850 [Rhizobium sp. 32-5/1]
MAFSSLASPQARLALRNLESIHVLAVVALFVLCFWFAAWSLVWQFGFAAGYYELWSRQFLIFWLVSMTLFVVAGFIPARNFKKRVRDLEGGASGRAARERQLQEACDDLRQWRDAAPKPSRQQRDRIAELELFIAGLKDQRIHSPWLDARLLFVILFVNAALFAMPFVMPQIDLIGVIGSPRASAQ